VDRQASQSPGHCKRESLLQRNIEYLQHYGITEVVVNVHHFSDQIIDAIDASKGWGSHITISDERDEVLETGGGLLKARPLLENGERFLTINVDILTDLNLKRLLDYHKDYKPLISFGVTGRPTSRYFYSTSTIASAAGAIKRRAKNASPFLKMI